MPQWPLAMKPKVGAGDSKFPNAAVTDDATRRDIDAA